MGDLLQHMNPVTDRWMGVEELMDPALMVLQGVIDAHACGGMVELGEWLVVSFELV
jgi:hypothetical protein